jgi:hypothetical protein
MEDPAQYRRSKILLDTPPQGLNGMPISVDRWRMNVSLSTPLVRMSAATIIRSPCPFCRVSLGFRAQSTGDWLVSSILTVGSRWWRVDCHWAKLVGSVALVSRACNTYVWLLIWRVAVVGLLLGWRFFMRAVIPVVIWIGVIAIDVMAWVWVHVHILGLGFWLKTCCAVNVTWRVENLGVAFLWLGRLVGWVHRLHVFQSFHDS